MSGYLGQSGHAYSELVSYARPFDSSSVMSIDSLRTETVRDGIPTDKVIIAYQAIDRQCGSCHQGSHSTNTKALTIFNLADECWYCKLTKEHAAGVMRRTQGAVFSNDEKKAIKLLMEELTENNR